MDPYSAPLIVREATCVLFLVAYRYYGRFLDKTFRIDDEKVTPAFECEDGVDFVPTRASVVFGHHFSSIAGTGPIVGPVFAAIYFGWGPAWLWIVLGSVFVGGLHDYGSTFLSIRNRGKSIAEVSKDLVGPWVGRLFMVFVLAALIYVLIVFLDLTAENFIVRPAVATASGWFVVVAFVFGVVARGALLPLWGSLLVFVPLTFFGLWIGQYLPFPELTKNGWIVLLIFYCFVAAILPVNVLLQPRDFLSSFFLYAIIVSGFFGIILGSPQVEGRFFVGWFNESANPGYLVPALFITVACGACSGFHSIVSSGTTSKQVRRESDIRKISYGAMLTEGVLATLALGTVIVISSSDIAAVNGNPNLVFASGFSRFLAGFGIPIEVGMEFALLGLTTFLLTTLDTCTRLCRFILEEMLQWKSSLSRYLGTGIVLIVPAVLALQTFEGQPAWKAIWPMFGATNQVLAGLALVIILALLAVIVIFVLRAWIRVRAAALLFLPYAAWVAFASVLNASLLILNS